MTDKAIARISRFRKAYPGLSAKLTDFECLSVLDTKKANKAYVDYIINKKVFGK